jgi:hypothetical protein
VPDPRPATAARKAKFAANVQRLMEDRGLSVRETANRAGIKDKKRFYRWATSGIARAAHAHDADLARLKALFRLPSVEQLWGDPPEASVEDLLASGAGGNPDHGYAYKLLVVLRAFEDQRADAIRNVIDEAFDEVTQNTTADDIMHALTPKQILVRLEQQSPKAYANLLAAVPADIIYRSLTDWLKRSPVDPVGKLIESYEHRD